jgi:cobalt-zinc-cadmium resistance protein CzcA
MLFAVSMMNVLGISANLMSLGAIDFGLIVDGAVIIVEAIVHRLQVGFAGQKLTAAQMDKEVQTASIKIRSSAAFGEIIILMVYIPILALVGIEGKMFKPMAETVMLAIGGALVLSLTYVPMMSALFLNKKVSDKKTFLPSASLFSAAWAGSSSPHWKKATWPCSKSCPQVRRCRKASRCPK